MTDRAEEFALAPGCDERRRRRGKIQDLRRRGNLRPRIPNVASSSLQPANPTHDNVLASVTKLALTIICNPARIAVDINVVRFVY